MSARVNSSARTKRPLSEPPDAAPRPFLKWAGGKRLLAPIIAPKLPKDLEQRRYREPFVGGGALFFHLRARLDPERVFLSDALGDLIRTYQAVRDDVEGLLEELERLRDRHSKEHFYEVREHFNAATGADLKRAAWLVYLNKTCFNGLFRTNRSGRFNVPFGRFTKPHIADHARLRAAAAALRGVDIREQGFEHLAKVAKRGDVIYLDPPYVPLSKTANFAAYADGAFGPDDQRRLAALFQELSARGCLLALSNSDTPEVRALYKGFEITTLEANRSISAVGSTRAPVNEVLVRNTARWPAKARPRE